MVKLWVANTDPDWFDYLADQPNIEEVNFWQPSGNNEFAAIQAGELFLFKLKAPRNAIGGFGVLSQASNLPLSLAWEAFGTKNGAPSFREMRDRVDRYRSDTRTGVDYTIGWRQVSGSDQPARNLLEQASIEDVDLLDTLEALRKVTSSAQDNRAHLPEGWLKDFIDVEATKVRLKEIARGEGTTADRAAVLSNLWWADD